MIPHPGILFRRRRSQYTRRSRPTRAMRRDSHPATPSWSPQTKLVVAIGLAVGTIYALYLARGAFGLVAIAGLIAFLLAPAIRFLHERLGWPRPVALLVVYLVAVVAAVLVGLLVTAATVSSLQQMDLPGMAADVRNWLLEVTTEFRTITIFGVTVDLSGVMDRLRSLLTTPPGDGAGGPPIIGLDPDQIGALLSQLVGGAYSVLAMVLGLFMSLIVTLLVAIYFNADSRRIHDGALSLVPAAYRDDALRVAARIKGIWTGYLYGQLVNSIITGFMVFVVLAAIGLPGAFLMGLIMALLNMIPTFGPIFAAVPGILAALVSGSSRLDMSNLGFAALVTIIYVVVVQLQANLIAPRVMGSAVQLRPVTIIVGLIVGVGVAGLLGALLAVPVIATVKTVALYLYDRVIDADPFQRDGLADC